MKNNLSILIYSLASGGAEKVVSVLLNELHSKYNLTLVLMNDTIFYDIPKDLKVVYLENSFPTEKGIVKLLKLPFLAHKYNKFCENNDIDISLSFMNRPNYINILSKFMGVKSKIIVNERAMPSLQHKKGLQGFINRCLIKYLYNQADFVLSNSLGNKEDLIKNFAIKNVSTIYNPIDINNISLLSNQNIEFRDEKFTFITIGRLDEGKNHKLMIKAMNSIDAKLYIIGDGILKQQLIDLVKSYNLNNKVFFLGKQKNPYQYLKNADCFLFTSLYEGFPNVLLEALSCNLPIISTDCKSGPREILSKVVKNNETDNMLVELEEYGILIKENSLDGLIEAMNMIQANSNISFEYSQKSVLRVCDFSKDKIIKEWFLFFKKVN